MDDDDLDLTDYLEAMDRALAVHEAGDAIVAWALGADVVFVEIDLVTGNGGSRSSNFDEVRSRTSRSASRAAEPSICLMRRD
jgi:hypothetical protein